jgi:hypothetical protein
MVDDEELKSEKPRELGKARAYKQPLNPYSIWDKDYHSKIKTKRKDCGKTS